MPHIVFIAVQGNDRLVEADLPENASIEIVHATVKAAGIEIDEEFSHGINHRARRWMTSTAATSFKASSAATRTV